MSESIALPPIMVQLLVELYLILVTVWSHGWRTSLNAIGIPVVERAEDWRFRFAEIKLAFPGCISTGIGILNKVE